MGLTHDVRPGDGLDQFRLGDSLKTVLDFLVGNTFFYPKVEISWDEDRAHTSPVTIHLPQPNLTLFFPAPEQILTLISVPVPTSLRLKCGNELLCAASAPLSRGKIGQVLGPTYATGSNLLKYPGIVFTLSGSSSRDDTVEKIEIVPKENERPDRSPIRGAVLEPGRGATLHLGELEVKLVLGETTAQDLILDLGSPGHMYWKEDDRMERIWAAARDTSRRQDADEKLCCFYSYRQYGLEFLLDDNSTLVKIIAHSNIPGTALFHRYERCRWSIQSATGPLTSSSPSSLFRSSLSSNGLTSSSDVVTSSHLDVPPASARAAARQKKRSGSDNSAVSNGSSDSSGSTSKVQGGREPSTTTRATMAPEGARVGGEPTGGDDEDAMLLDRLGERGMKGVLNIGPTRLIGLQGVVLEEDEKSGGICSVLVYKA